MAALPGQGHLSWLQPLAGDGSEDGDGDGDGQGCGCRAWWVQCERGWSRARTAGSASWGSGLSLVVSGKAESELRLDVPAGCWCVSFSPKGRVAPLGKLLSSSCIESI